SSQRRYFKLRMRFQQLDKALTDHSGGAEDAYAKLVRHEMDPVCLCLLNLIEEILAPRPNVLRLRSTSVRRRKTRYAESPGPRCQTQTPESSPRLGQARLRPLAGRLR